MNEVTLDVIEDARRFALRNIRPFAAEIDRQQKLPLQVIAAMAAKGYLGATIPVVYNGMGMDPVTYGLLTEQIGKACASTRSLLTVHTSLVGEAILRHGSETQRSHWLPAMAAGEKIGAFALSEPGIGSDAAGVTTAYRKKGSAYVLNGNKRWISFGAIADFFIVIAREGSDITAFLVEADTPGVSRVPIEGMLGNRGAQLAEIVFRDAEVQEANVLGKEGQGFSCIVNTALDHGRYSIAWAGLAIAQESLDAMSGYACTREQFGKRLFRHQSIQAMIAESTIGVHAARALCLRAGSMRKDRHADAVTETIIAKCHTSRIAMKTAMDAVQIHGANGCWDGYPVERLFREAKILEIIEGTTQIHQEVITHYSMRQYGMPYNKERATGQYHLNENA